MNRFARKGYPQLYVVVFQYFYFYDKKATKKSRKICKKFYGIVVKKKVGNECVYLSHRIVRNLLLKI